MKTMIVLLSLLVATVSSADSDYRKQLKNKFQTLSATEAMSFAQQNANVYHRAWNKNLPGTNTWFDPINSLCQTATTVQTVKPQSECVLWQGKMHDEFSGWVTYENKASAKIWGDEDHDLRCIQQSAPQIISRPKYYTAEECVLWQVRVDGEIKTYNSKFAAKGRSDRNARCVQTAPVAKQISTTFEISYYYSKDFDSKNLLGTHTYSLPQCAGGTVPPAPAY